MKIEKPHEWPKNGSRKTPLNAMAELAKGFGAGASRWIADPVRRAVSSLAGSVAQDVHVRFPRVKKRKKDPLLDDKRILIQAASDGDVQTLREMVAKSPQCVDCKLTKEDLAPGQEPFEGLTPLMVAMQMNNADCVAFLAPLSDVGLRDDTGPWKMAKTGRSALMRAARQSFEMFNILWPFASQEAINANGGVSATVLWEAILAENYGAMRLLLADGRHDLSLQSPDWKDPNPEAKMVALDLAVGVGDEEALKIMLPWHSEKTKIESFEKGIRCCVEHDVASLAPGSSGVLCPAWPCVDLLAFHVPEEIANRGLAAAGPECEKKMPAWAGRVAAETEAQALRETLAKQSVGASEPSSKASRVQATEPKRKNNPRL